MVGNQIFRSGIRLYRDPRWGTDGFGPSVSDFRFTLGYVDCAINSFWAGEIAARQTGGDVGGRSISRNVAVPECRLSDDRPASRSPFTRPNDLPCLNVHHRASTRPPGGGSLLPVGQRIRANCQFGGVSVKSQHQDAIDLWVLSPRMTKRRRPELLLKEDVASRASVIV